MALVGRTIDKYETPPVDKVPDDTKPRKSILPSITPPLSTAFPYEDRRLLVLARIYERELKHEADAKIYPYNILAQAKADYSAGHHNVYVVELSRSVLPSSKALFIGFPSMPCVYVGLNGLTPEQRFEKHRSGHKSSNKVYKYGVRLLRDSIRSKIPSHSLWPKKLSQP